MNEVSALGQQMQASMSAYSGAHATGVVALTQEQIASLRSAIALLRQGEDMEDEPMVFLPPPDHFTAADDGTNLPDSYDDDRDSFSGMYS